MASKAAGIDYRGWAVEPCDGDADAACDEPAVLDISGARLCQDRDAGAAEHRTGIKDVAGIGEQDAGIGQIFRISSGGLD